MARTFNLPDLTGNANRYLQVTSSGTGLQWTPVSPGPTGYTGYTGHT